MVDFAQDPNFVAWMLGEISQSAGVLISQSFGAVGNGTTDDTRALQAFFDATAATQSHGQLALGNYKITAPLNVSPNCYISGCGRTFGTRISPVGCRLFNIDGAGPKGSGGFVFRDTFSDIIFDMSNSVDANYGVYMNSVYNIEFYRCWLFHSPDATDAGWYVKGPALDCIWDACLTYGTTGVSGYAMKFDASAGVVSAKLGDVDLEGTNRGVYTSGSQGMHLDLLSPYMERMVVCLDHNSTGPIDSINVIGGSLTSSNGYVANIAQDHFHINGTNCNSFGGAANGIFNLPKTTPYLDVSLRNIPQLGLAPGNTPVFLPGSNLLGVDVWPPAVANMLRNVVDFSKTLVSGTPTNILKIGGIDSLAKCRLTITATTNGGVGIAVKQYDFIVTADTLDGLTDPIVTTLSDFHNANYQAVINSLTLTGGGSAVTVGITVTTSGAIGGVPLIFGQLEVMAVNAGVGYVNLL